MLQYKKQKVHEAQRIAAKTLDKQILHKQVLGDAAYLRATLTSRMSLQQAPGKKEQKATKTASKSTKTTYTIEDLDKLLY